MTLEPCVDVRKMVERISDVPDLEIVDGQDRKAVSDANRAINIWASVKWHRNSNCAGTPLMDWLFEDGQPNRWVQLQRVRGRWVPFCGSPDDWDRLVRKHPENVKREDILRDRSSSSDAKKTGVDLVELSVSHALRAIGCSKLIEHLLIHRRPEKGPYARSETIRSYRRFRPPGFYVAVGCGKLRGEGIEKAIDKLLGAWERAVLDQVAGLGKENSKKV